MKRITLATSMGVVFCIAIGTAGLTHPTELWASGLFTLAVALFGWASVAATLRRRAFWRGFAFFGWVYLILSLGLFSAKGTPLASFPPPPPLLTTRLMDYVERRVIPGSSVFDNMPPMRPTWPSPASSAPFQITLLGSPDLTHTYFHQIGHTLMALLVATAGATLAGLTLHDRRQYPPEPAPASERPLEA